MERLQRQVSRKYEVAKKEKIKLKERCNKYSIEVKEADRYYPSSKMCSRCKNIKKKLLLCERIYKCNICNNKISRDLNAAINLANYNY